MERLSYLALPQLIKSAIIQLIEVRGSWRSVLRLSQTRAGRQRAFPNRIQSLTSAHEMHVP